MTAVEHPHHGELVAADVAHVVHHMAPRMSLAQPPTLMARGQGMRLWDTAGREYLDAVSGMFNVNIGYGRSELAEVVAEDVARLGFAPPFGLQGSVPLARLAGRLAAVTPPGINRFFFTVGGSDAVDSAIKFARRYHALRGAPSRTGVIARERSYHGMSFGALSATGLDPYRDGVGPVVPDFHHVGQPSGTYEAAHELEQLILEVDPERIAAFLVEPISLTAGVLVPPKGYLTAMREVCRKHGVLLVVDEVITGFGRTGAMFAVDHWGIRPDLLVLAKAITSGYLPLGAVGMSDHVFETIVPSDDRLLNGFSGGGHPTACAVALANLEIMQRERLVRNSRARGAELLERLTELTRSHPEVGNARGLGLMAAVDVVDRSGADAAVRVASALHDAGMLVRSYGPAVALGPSLIATAADVDEVVARLAQAIEAVFRT